MDTLRISVDVLEWAAAQKGESLLSIAEKMAGPRSLGKLLSGNFTASQLEKYASITKVPFGYLFLEKPPQIEKPKLPDFRKVQHATRFGDDFYEVLEDIQKKQDWYIEYLKDLGAEPLEFVGSHKHSTTPQDIALSIATTAKIGHKERKLAKNPEDYFRILSEKFESIGILVFKNSIVRSSTKRPLSVSEFRGFAIANDIAPAVFINGRDAEAAWCFTLAHEVAHIWIGETAVSDIPEPKDVTNSIELLCNRVAAELLTPLSEFMEKWGESKSIDVCSRHFRVSRLVIARRAYELDLITRQEYRTVYANSYKAQKDDSGGNPFNTIPVRNSKKLTTALVRNAMEGGVLLRDAARLLNITPDTVTSLYKKKIRIYG